jgi:hypothetical protein
LRRDAERHAESCCLDAAALKASRAALKGQITKLRKKLEVTEPTQEPDHAE